MSTSDLARQAAAADSIDAVRVQMTGIAADWETLSPARAATALWALRRRSGDLSRRVRGPAGLDSARTFVQLRAMEAEALIGAGLPEAAWEAASDAAERALRVGDPALVSHTQTIAAAAAPLARVRVNRGRLLDVASGRAAGGFGAAIARTARASALAEAGPDAARDVMAAVRAAEAADLGDEQSGYALEGWDPAVRASFCGAALARVGLVGPARERLAVATAAFGPGADGTVAAPGIYAMTLLYSARCELAAGNADQAKTLTGRALVAARDRPSAHVAAGAISLASLADPRGTSWDDIKERARAVTPPPAV